MTWFLRTERTEVRAPRDTRDLSSPVRRPRHVRERMLAKLWVQTKYRKTLATLHVREHAQRRIGPYCTAMKARVSLGLQRKRAEPKRKSATSRRNTFEESRSQGNHRVCRFYQCNEPS